MQHKHTHKDKQISNIYMHLFIDLIILFILLFIQVQ